MTLYMVKIKPDVNYGLVSFWILARGDRYLWDTKPIVMDDFNILKKYPRYHLFIPMGLLDIAHSVSKSFFPNLISQK